MYYVYAHIVEEVPWAINRGALSYQQQNTI